MKPVELIVSNSTHAIAASLNMLDASAAKAYALWPDKPKAMDDQLRRLLCDVSHQASIAMVRRALAAIGAPSSADELEQRIQAAAEAQRHEALVP